MITTKVESIGTLFREINRGTDWRAVGDAISAEHGYLVNEFSQGWARGILRKSWPDKSCGEVMYPLANGANPERGTVEWMFAQDARRDHPYHDGELSCNVVRAALLVLHVEKWKTGDMLEFWRGDR